MNLLTSSVIVDLMWCPSTFDYKQRGADLRDFGNDFAQTTLDREEDTTHFLELEVNDFQFNPPPLQCWCLSIDSHEIHFSHVQFWNYRNREYYANRHISTTSCPLSSPFKPSSTPLVVGTVGCTGIGIRVSISNDLVHTDNDKQGRCKFLALDPSLISHFSLPHKAKTTPFSLT